MTAYIGVDVSKPILDVDLLGKPIKLENNNRGINELISKLQDPNIKNSLKALVFEASGGYEKLLENTCNKMSIPFHLAHANKVRAFAKSKGILAKTDKLDASILSQYGTVMDVSPDKLLLSKNAQKMRLLLGRREQLLNDKKRENNRLDKVDDEFIEHSVILHIEWLADQIKVIDKKLDELSKADDVKEKHSLLTSIPAVGGLVANYLIARLPELGLLSHKAIAAIVGVAPYNRDSGSFNGKRYIQGGRKELRKVLYMSALSSIRWNPDMKVFYKRLRESGKPAKVAIIAVMRKLLCVVNSVIKRQTPWHARP